MHTGRHHSLGLALVVVLVTGLAFSTAGTSASAQTAQPAQQAPSHHRLFGAVTSISADSLVVTGRDGTPVTVRMTADTKIVERAAAHLADIQAGDRIRIVASKTQDGALTALAVQDLPSDLAIGRRSAGGMRELSSGRVLIGGSVVSIGETSLSVTAAGGAATTVAVPSTARIQRLTALPVTGLAAGMRLAVQGTGNSDGSVTASVILVVGKAKP